MTTLTDTVNDLIQVEVLLNASVEDIWSAITDPEKMRRWYFENIPDFKAEVGFKTKFEMGSEEKIFTANWEVLEVTENKRIKYSWTFEEYDGLGTTDFIISEKDGKSLLTLLDLGHTSFPQDIPEFKRESCIAGWEYFLKERLWNYIESKS